MLRPAARFVVSALLFSTALLAAVAGTDTPRPKAADSVAVTRLELSLPLRLPDRTIPAGKLLTAGKPTAFVFVGVSCPIANAAAPELSAIQRSVAPRGGRVVLVYSNPGDAAESAEHAARFGLQGLTRVLDERQTLADALGAKVTPEAFVVDGAGRVRYRGRIDDRSAARAKPRGTDASRHDLLSAMQRLLDGKAPVAAQVPAVGCVLERSGRRDAPTEPTYAGEVAAILNENCVACHRKGEIGPMGLESYTQARRFADNIASVASDRLMPPWKPVEGHGDFKGVRKLTDAQIDTLARWAKAGAPAGDLKSAPTPPRFTTGWALGKPDLVLTMPRAWTVPAGGPDDYRCFVLPTGLTEDREVVGVEYRAGNKSVVHHVLGFVDTRGEGKRRDAADPGEGYTSFGGPGFLPSGEVGGWAPGNLPQFLPEGIARPLPAGSDIIIQVHYHPIGREESDITQVGLYFAKKPITKHLRVLPLVAGVDIAPGDAAYKTSQSYPMPIDARAIFVVPHMHLLGKQIRLDAKLPDGTVKPMVRIDDWDFNWQDTYTYREAFPLPKGTVLTLAAQYDNSPANPRQPVSPPKRVTWGEATTDEMCIAFIGFVADKEDDPMLRLLDSLFGGGGGRGARRTKQP